MQTLVKWLRFFYLLWGGILIGTLAINNRIQLPEFMGRWIWLLRFMFMPLGRSFLLGIAVVMSISAIIEIWELIGQLLVTFSRDKQGD